MAKVFSSTVEIQTYVNKLITKALMAASVRITKELRLIIDEQYYKDPSFYPNVYRRTYKFLDSASYELLGSNMAQIGIDTDMMNYYNGFDADQIVEWASDSKHGADYYQTDAVDFWTTFNQWADQNVSRILKEELINQGLKITK